LEHFNLGLSAANIGIMFVRKAALPLVVEWNTMLDKDDKIWDQNAFNDLFRRGTGRELPDRLFMAYDVRARITNPVHVLGGVIEILRSRDHAFSLPLLPDRTS
jgi:hypothetical protein